MVRHTEMAPCTSSAAHTDWVQKLRSYPPGSSRRPTTQDAAPGVRLDIDSDMRKVFERALRGRKIFGTPALQGGGGRGQVEKVALCWQAFCRVCAIALQRGHAVKVGSIATLWRDEHAAAGSAATHAAFDVAFLLQGRQVDLDYSAGRFTVTSKETGDASDNPTDPLMLDDEQRSKAASFFFQDFSSFEVSDAPPDRTPRLRPSAAPPPLPLCPTRPRQPTGA